MEPYNSEACHVCHRTPPEVSLKRCSTCIGIQYCSRTCQSADWKRHKLECRPLPTTTILTAEQLSEDFGRVGMLTKLVHLRNYAMIHKICSKINCFSVFPFKVIAGEKVDIEARARFGLTETDRMYAILTECDTTLSNKGFIQDNICIYYEKTPGTPEKGIRIQISTPPYVDTVEYRKTIVRTTKSIFPYLTLASAFFADNDRYSIQVMLLAVPSKAELYLLSLSDGKVSIGV